MRELSRLEKISLLLAVLFLGMCVGYLFGNRSVGKPYRVTTARNDSQPERAAVSTETDSRPVSLLEGEVININTAQSVDLQRLPGIGESRAQSIVDWREENGPFEKPEDLLDVSGIGIGIFQNIQAYITVGEMTE